MRKQPLILHVVSVPETLLSFFDGQIEFMKKNGFEVAAVSSPGDIIEIVEKRDNIKVYQIPIERNMGSLYDIVSLFRLIRLILKLKPTIVHGHTPKGAFLGMIAAWITRVPIRVYTLHGLRYTGEIGLRRSILKFVEKITCKLAHVVLAVSESVKKEIHSSGICDPSKLKVLANGTCNGIDAITKFNPDLYPDARQKLRHKYGIPFDAVVLCFAGRIVPDKGIIELTRVWQQLRNEFGNLFFLIAGSPEGLEELPTDIQDCLKNDSRIIMTGFIHSIAEHYACSDILVLPSYREGFPYVPMESAAMGIPAVATTVHGCIDAIVDGKTGLLVPPKNIESLHDKLSLLIKDKEKRLELGKNARQRILESFLPEQIWKELHAQYLSLLSGAGFTIKQACADSPIEIFIPIKVAVVAAVDMSFKYLLMSQIKYMEAQGYDIRCLCSPGPFWKELKNDGLNMVAVKITRAITPWSDLLAFLYLYRYFRKNHIDIVHTHTPKCNLLGQVAAVLARVPSTISTVHGYYFHENMDNIPRRFFISMAWISSKCASRILSQNPEDVATALKLKLCKIDKIKLLGNGIDLTKFDPRQYDDIFRQHKRTELFIPPDALLVCINARLVREKGYIELVEAMSTLMVKYHHLWLLVIGSREPSKTDNLSVELFNQKEIRERTILLSNRNDIPELLACADIFVLPSWREGFPRSAIEAAAMALPIVTTNTRGCRQVVEHGKNGLLVSPKNVNELKDAMDTLISNPNMRISMGQAGYQKAQHEFDEQKVFQIVLQTYTECLKEKNNRGGN